MDVDERLLRLELRVNAVEKDMTRLRTEAHDERGELLKVHNNVSSIKDMLSEHIISESKGQTKLFIGISGGLVVGIAVLVLFIFQLTYKV